MKTSRSEVSLKTSGWERQCYLPLCFSLQIKLPRLGFGANSNTEAFYICLLAGQEVFCTLQEFNSPVFATNNGLPLGSVLGPLLFNLFVADIYKKTCSERVKYADDGTIWRRGRYILRLEHCLKLT